MAASAGHDILCYYLESLGDWQEGGSRAVSDFTVKAAVCNWEEKGRTFGGLGFVGVVGADEMVEVLVYGRAVGAAVVFHPSLECRWRARPAKVAGDGDAEASEDAGDAEASEDGSRHGGGGTGLGVWRVGSVRHGLGGSCQAGLSREAGEAGVGRHQARAS